ncbi:MAG: hypothetical protein K2H60_02175 [Muribaculaceae bacterium]|nr:hypothetical protein [Muribaculaceae bacterium]
MTANFNTDINRIDSEAWRAKWEERSQLIACGTYRQGDKKKNALSSALPKHSA